LPSGAGVFYCLKGGFVRHHLTLELTDSVSSLIRVVSCLHSRGLRVEHLHLRGTSGCMSVAGNVALHRVVATLDRLVDVLAVEPSSSCDQRAPAFADR
jgi:acetolactate synthase regulatory subunit